MKTTLTIIAAMTLFGVSTGCVNFEKPLLGEPVRCGTKMGPIKFVRDPNKVKNCQKGRRLRIHKLGKLDLFKQTKPNILKAREEAALETLIARGDTLLVELEIIKMDRAEFIGRMFLCKPPAKSTTKAEEKTGAKQ